jgi:gas vesicle protein
MSRDNRGSNLVFFIVGAAIGASVALLYAPQDGQSTRKLITDKAVDVKDKATEIASGVTESAKDRWSAASGKIQDILQRSPVDEALTLTDTVSSNGAGS